MKCKHCKGKGEVYVHDRSADGHGGLNGGAWFGSNAQNVAVQDGNDRLDFDPNKLGPSYMWATYVPSRTPHFKVHRMVGHAKNAMHLYERAIRYDWNKESQQWVEVERKGA